MITDSFRKAISRKSEKSWDKIYIMIDIHDTIFKSTYTEEISFEWAGLFTEKCLKLLSDDPGFVLILWTSSYERDIEKYIDFLSTRGIQFDYVNENPEELSNKISDFSKKPYFNILLDDKAGFNPEVDWWAIYNYLINYD